VYVIGLAARSLLAVSGFFATDIKLAW
jgi:hypothetical protein